MERVYLLVALTGLLAVPVFSSSVWSIDKSRILPSYAASCNFLCYSGVLSSSDGCVCSRNMCTFGMCRSNERCITKEIKGIAVPICCPKRRHKACMFRPKYHARRGRRLYYFRSRTGTCHRFIPTRADPNMYFRSYYGCVSSCACRRAPMKRSY